MNKNKDSDIYKWILIQGKMSYKLQKSFKVMKMWDG